MAQVTLRINGHAHTVGCKDGEEAHLLAMADEVEKRIDKAKALGAQSGEARLLVMAALFMADEIHDLQLELQAVRKGKPGTPERVKSDRITRIAARAEEIAASTERH
ncbi:MAG TPA: cell division protein ZapA [Acetobacteraceae bacterium]|nr:cell division protein ZapA [Acetobacteraceae bacterium]